MSKIAFAEWILALTVAPDRAATTVGDLVEEASTRSVVWFWSSVLWTALSHFWRDLSASPFRMVRLAIWGLFAENLLIVIPVFPVMLVWQWILDRWGPIVDNHTTVVPQWATSTLSIVFGIILIPFLVGWMVAHRSHRKEMAAAFSLNLVSAAIHFLFMYLSALQVRRIGRPFPGIENTVITVCIRPLFIAGGAIFFRNYGPKSSPSTPST